MNMAIAANMALHHQQSINQPETSATYRRCLGDVIHCDCVVYVNCRYDISGTLDVITHHAQQIRLCVTVVLP